MLRQKCALLCACLVSVVLIGITGCGGSSASISVNITASAATVDGADSITLTASVTNDHNSAGVTFTSSGGGTLSNTTTSSATFTAPTATSSAQTITITATSIADSTKTGTVSITVPAAPAITSTSASLAGSVGTAYSINLQVNGGIAPYTWSVASGSTLPTGLTLSSSGQLTGTPPASAAGTTNVTFNVKDSGTPNALSASTSLAITIAAAPTLSFAGTMPTSAIINTAFNGSAHATGGAGTLTYSLVSGALPTGTSLNTSTGAVTGTVTAVGTFTFKIGVADAFGDAASNTYTVTVSYPAMAITTGSLLPAAYVNGNYSQSLSATGGTNVSSNYAWTLTGGTVLPAGLNLSAAGVISGKPTGATGTTSFSVQVMDTVANISTTGSFSIAVNAGVSITSTSPLAGGYVGSNYSVQLGATGGTGTGYTWTVSSGSSLPAGLTLSSGGLISGKPTATGTTSVSITVTDSASNSTSQTFSITISAGVSITSSSTLPKGYQGTIYPGATFTATGGTGTGYSWTWAAASGSSLPGGLSLSPAGLVSGTPSAAGTFSIVVTVSDSLSNTASATVSLTVEAALSISPSTLPSGTVNVLYSQSLTATGGSGTGYTWTSLANTNTTLGITLSAAGVISGTPTVTGSTTITAQVTDSESHTTSAMLTVNVYNVLTVSTTTLPADNVGTAYSQTLSAGGGSGTGYTWTATSSNLSSYGLSLSSAGVVSGTPTTAGTASFTAKVTDSANNTATQALTIQIYSGLSLPAPNSLPGGYTGIAYNGSLNASGGSGNYCWAVTGLPSDNLNSPSANSACGYVSTSLPISGTPGSAATVTFHVQLTDTSTNNSIGQTYSITVSNPTAPALPSSNPAAATVNQAYSQTITATGGVGPNYTWTVNGSAVPTSGSAVALGTSGLTVSNTGTNVLSLGGTATATGSVAFTASVTDNTTHLNSSTQSYSITVNPAGGSISGQVSLANYCNNGPGLPLTFTVTATPSSGTPQQTTTDSSGNYSFSSLPFGTYTITASVSGAASTLFSPANYSNVNLSTSNSSITGESFNAVVGYNISGAVSYSGSQAGQVYLYLNNATCGGSQDTPGTSITETTLTSGGAYTIHGVGPGTYTVNAWMDADGITSGTGYPGQQGALNANNPTGVSSTFSVTNANATGVGLTLSDPTFATPANNPSIKVIPNANGVLLFYGPPTVNNSNGNKEEAANEYTVEWAVSNGSDSDGPTCSLGGGTGGAQFATIAGSHTFYATGTNSTVWILNNTNLGSSTFTSGQNYCFQVRAFNTLAGTTHPSGWTTPTDSDGNAQAYTIAAQSCSGTCTTMSGSVTIPSGVTIASGVPLYVGFYQNSSSGNGPSAIYSTEITSPAVGANSYSITIPSGSGYVLFGILDQNNDGAIDAGDVTNVRNNNSSGVTVSGSSMSGVNTTLPGTNSTAQVQTLYSSCGTNCTSYSLQLNVNEANKLPVNVTLYSGPNLLNPVDISACSSCGNVKYQYYATLPGGATPNVGDTYDFTVTYSDGSVDQGSAGTINGAVTGWNGGSTVVGASDAPTNLAPSGTSSTSTTPTFSWTDASASSGSGFYYSFYLSANTCSGSCTIWQIPSQNSNSNGFASSITSITWGTDPTGGGSAPSVGSLTSGSQYTWSVSVQDSNGNQAQTSTGYQP